MKRLYRLSESRKIAGVCAGLGEYLGVDPTVIRILFLIVTFFWGFGILVYLVCWVVMPQKDEIKND